MSVLLNKLGIDRTMLMLYPTFYIFLAIAFYLGAQTTHFLSDLPGFLYGAIIFSSIALIIHSSLIRFQRRDLLRFLYAGVALFLCFIHFLGAMTAWSFYSLEGIEATNATMRMKLFFAIFSVFYMVIAVSLLLRLYSVIIVAGLIPLILSATLFRTNVIEVFNNDELYGPFELFCTIGMMSITVFGIIPHVFISTKHPEVPRP
jgi:hypothetical protein